MDGNISGSHEWLVIKKVINEHIEEYHRRLEVLTDEIERSRAQGKIMECRRLLSEFEPE